MITLIVKNDQKELLGKIVFSEENVPMVRESECEILTTIFNDILREGVTRLEDIPGEHERALVCVPVGEKDPNFPLALKESLEAHGLRVEIDHPEVMEELLRLLADIPDEDFEKQELIKRFPELTYLEQTYILKQFASLNERP